MSDAPAPSFAEKLMVLVQKLSRESDGHAMLRTAVEAGRQLLSLDRIAFFLLDPDTHDLRGTWGVDAKGRLRHEASQRFEEQLWLDWVTFAQPAGYRFANAEQLKQHYKKLAEASPLAFVQKETELYDEKGRPAGKGDLLQSVLWTGTEMRGAAFADNLLSQRPFTEEDRHRFGLYVSTVGHLWERLNAEAELRASHARLESNLLDRDSEITNTIRTLQKERALLRTLLDHLPEKIFFKDERSHFLLINKSTASHFGLGHPDKALGMTDHDFFDAVHADKARADELHVMSTGIPMLNTEEREVHRDGRVSWASTSKLPYHDAEGKVIGTFGISRDITSAKEAELALRDSERRFRLIWESSTDGMLITDRSGIIIDANPAYCRLVEMERRALQGNPVSTAFEHSPPAAPEQPRDGAFMEVPVRLRNGREAVLQISHAVVGLSDEQRLLLSVHRDVTSQKQEEADRRAIERKMLDAQKLESLGVLAGGIAHDFNNLLTGIMGNVGLAGLQLEPGSPVKAYLSNIEKTSIQAAELCQQMLAYSGKGRFNVRVHDINQLVGEMSHLLQISVHKKVALSFDLTPGLPPVEADASQIRQVILNLVINASEATADRSGAIRVHTGIMRADAAYFRTAHTEASLPEGYYVHLEVSDTGTGMPPETVARIFEPFYTTKFTGRGLGLAAVLGIVKSHKGCLRVVSEPGKGSTFRVLLPCLQNRVADAPLDPVPSALAGWRGRGTILVVDDEESVRTLAARMLESFGFATLTAPDGREALAVFRERRSDLALVLLDMSMPHLNGEEAFREMHGLQPSVPVLLMSGYHEREAMERFAGKGLAGFVQKPFKMDDLAGKIREILPGP